MWLMIIILLKVENQNWIIANFSKTHIDDQGCDEWFCKGR